MRFWNLWLGFQSPENNIVSIYSMCLAPNLFCLTDTICQDVFSAGFGMRRGAVSSAARRLFHLPSRGFSSRVFSDGSGTLAQCFIGKKIRDV